MCVCVLAEAVRSLPIWRKVADEASLEWSGSTTKSL